MEEETLPMKCGQPEKNTDSNGELSDEDTDSQTDEEASPLTKEHSSQMLVPKQETQQENVDIIVEVKDLQPPLEVPKQESIISALVSGRATSKVAPTPSEEEGTPNQQPRDELKGKSNGNIRTRRKRKLRKVPPHQFIPFFMIITLMIYVGLFAWSIQRNGGFEDWSENPLFGPSSKVLVEFGAKYGPKLYLQKQYYRFVTPMFIHVGIIHLLLNASVQVRIGFALEREYGWWRISFIYFCSGISGNLASLLFLPDTVQVGASGALYGLMAALLVESIQFWGQKKHPCKELLQLVIIYVLLLGVGLLPYVDNFAHVGGFIAGLFSGLVVLPTLNFNRRRIFPVMIGFIGLIVYFAVAFQLFVSETNAAEWCEFCKFVNCLPIANWCNAEETTSETITIHAETSDT